MDSFIKLFYLYNMSEKQQLLSATQTLQKIKRIAHEIYENNFREKELIFVGTDQMGYVFAKMLKKEFDSIADIKSSLVKISLDKTAPLQSEITLDVPVKSLAKKVIILTDDVLNTGRTLAYSLKPFLNIDVKKLQTAVVVDRGHTTFPISANYVGYSLSTTLKEHIEVILDNKKELGVYLS